MRISDWSSDVCSSDLASVLALPDRLAQTLAERLALAGELGAQTDRKLAEAEAQLKRWAFHPNGTEGFAKAEVTVGGISTANLRSEEHTSELQSLMRTSYAVFCLKKQNATHRFPLN